MGFPINNEYQELIKAGTGKKYSYEKNDSILDMLIKQASLNPEKIAIVDDVNEITYDELFSKAAAVSDQLKKYNICHGDKIAILIEPDYRLLVIIIAIFMVSGCYVPIDFYYPADHIYSILNDSNSVLFITDKADFLHPNISVLMLNDINFQASKNYKNITIKLKGNDSAYAIYTSGTTGKPKGIIVPHQAVNNHMLWMIDEFGFISSDRFFLKTPLSFDPSIWEIFAGLYIGASIFVAKYNSHTNHNYLLNFIQKYKITVLQVVPFVLQKLLSSKNLLEKLNSLRYIFVGGESLCNITKSLFFQSELNCKLVNLYGPSEATIDITYHYVENNKNNFSYNLIGKPIYNENLYVFSSDMQLCQLGKAGQLCVAGDCLSHGYINNDMLTKEKFISNPYKESEKIYKTGDLVRWVKINNNYLLEYIGRLDKQIKLNGVRVEVDAIRNYILDIEHVYDCILEKEHVGENQYSILVCYIIPENGFQVDIDIIKNNLKNKFPIYMLPKKYFSLEKPIISRNGKLDLKNTKKLILKNINKKHTIKHDKITSELHDIWASILQMPICNDIINFYDVGGDSIASFILADKISREFGITFNPEDIIQYPSILKQSRYIRQLKKEKVNINKNIEPVISLNSETVRSVFLVHPIGGTIFWYTHLSKFLDKKLQLYGIQDPGVISGKKMFETVDQMAHYYRKKIQQFQPEGPYILGGASFGATVAIEIARQLIDLGHKVVSVLIFDGWAIYPNNLRDTNYFRASMLKQQEDWASKFNQLDLSIQSFKKLFEIQENRLNMLYNYKMQSINFHLDFFKAEEIMPIFKPIDEPFNYWHNYADDITKYVIPGNHETMFIESNVIEIAKILIKNFS